MNSPHSFGNAPSISLGRSTFDRSHGYKTTFDAGYLVPIYIDEALPGDTFNLKMNSFARLSTPIFPIMDNIKMDTFYFSIPYRLVWENWERFNGAQDKPGDNTDYVIPTMRPPTGGYLPNSLEDYMGLPVGNAGYEHSTLYHRAYNLIWNEWFRDENLQDSIEVKTDNGPDTPANYKLLKRNKRPDYFTTCLPWPQKGDDVMLPLGGQADIKYNSQHSGGVPTFRNFDGTQVTATNTVGYNGSYELSIIGHQSADKMAYDPMGTLFADMTTVTATTINDLRKAVQIQALFERDARGGTRYVELIKSHFGVTSPDYRLQRPEYLGGGSSPINIQPVPQTSSSVSDSPQGNVGGFGTAVMHPHGFNKSFTEHCLVIGLVNVRADLTYQRGLDKLWSRSTRFDFYWSAFAHLGEQPVLNKELFVEGSPKDEDVFGYQEIYADYRYKQSHLTGLFRSSHPQSLDAWHLAQDFQTAPKLNSAFITDNPPLDRVVAVPSEPHILFDSWFSLKCSRPIPSYSIPGFGTSF